MGFHVKLNDNYYEKMQFGKLNTGNLFYSERYGTMITEKIFIKTEVVSQKEYMRFNCVNLEGQHKWFNQESEVTLIDVDITATRRLAL